MNDGEPTRGFDLREGVLGGEELLLSLQDFVVAGLAFFVTHRRQLNRFASSADGLALLDALVLVSAMRDECIGNFAEGAEGRLLVTELGLLESGFRLSVTAGQAAAGKHRVEMRYAPGPLKSMLLAAGLACAGVITVIARRFDARRP